MGNLEKRVSQIEDARANSDLKKMSDEELSAYISTLGCCPFEPFASFRAIL